MSTNAGRFKLGYIRTQESVVKQFETVKSITKQCEVCKGTFSPTNPRQRWCTVCVPNQQARYRLLRYGLADPKYKHWIETNNGMCFICRKRKSKVVDHDHKTGRVRGLLCHKCNLSLTLIEDVEVLTRAIEYVRNK